MHSKLTGQEPRVETSFQRLTGLVATFGSAAILLVSLLIAPRQATAEEEPAQAPLSGRLAGSVLEVLDGSTGRVLDNISLPSPGLNLLQLGDIVYVLHRSSFSIFQLSSRSQEGQLVYASGGKSLHEFVCEGGDRLSLHYDDGSFELFDIREPARPVRVAGSSQPEAQRETTDEGPSHSSYVRSFFVTIKYPSLYSDFGGDYTPSGGVWAAAGLTIVNNFAFSYIPSFRVHGTVGYSGRYAAIGVDLGGGAGYSLLPYSIDLGIAVRFGRVAGVHVDLLAYWWVFPIMIQIPAGGELSLVAPVGSRSWFQLTFRGDLRLGIFGSGTMGAKHLVSSVQGRQSLFTWGLGASYVAGSTPGALIQLGYEYHH